MDLLRYRKVDHYKVARDIANYMNMGPKDQQHLEDFIQVNPYTWVLFEKKKPSHFLWRLSGIPYIIVYFLLFICIPAKWLFTGKAHYDYEGFIIRSLKKWKERLNF